MSILALRHQAPPINSGHSSFPMPIEHRRIVQGKKDIGAPEVLVCEMAFLQALGDSQRMRLLDVAIMERGIAYDPLAFCGVDVESHGRTVVGPYPSCAQTGGDFIFVFEEA